MKTLRLASLCALALFLDSAFSQDSDTIRQYQFAAGVDYVLDVGGRDTLQKALQALAYGGHIALIGGLSGPASDIPFGSLIGLGASASGIYVGSHANFGVMNAFITENQIRPVVDRVFDFEDAPAAFDSMENGSFVGKIVIRL